MSLRLLDVYLSHSLTVWAVSYSATCAAASQGVFPAFRVPTLTAYWLGLYAPVKLGSRSVLNCNFALLVRVNAFMALWRLIIRRRRARTDNYILHNLTGLIHMMGIA